MQERPVLELLNNLSLLHIRELLCMRPSHCDEARKQCVHSKYMGPSLEQRYTARQKRSQDFRLGHSGLLR